MPPRPPPRTMTAREPRYMRTPQRRLRRFDRDEPARRRARRRGRFLRPDRAALRATADQWSPGGAWRTARMPQTGLRTRAPAARRAKDGRGTRRIRTYPIVARATL